MKSILGRYVTFSADSYGRHISVAWYMQLMINLWSNVLESLILFIFHRADISSIERDKSSIGDVLFIPGSCSWSVLRNCQFTISFVSIKHPWTLWANESQCTLMSQNYNIANNIAQRSHLLALWDIYQETVWPRFQCDQYCPQNKCTGRDRRNTLRYHPIGHVICPVMV